MSTSKKSASDDADDLAQSWERLTEQLGKLRADLTDINDAAADLAKAGKTEGKARIESEIDEMTRRIASLSEELGKAGAGAAGKAGETATALGQELEKTITRNPMTALLIALGLGFLFGLTMRGRN